MTKQELIDEVIKCLDYISDGDWTFSDMGDYFYDILGDEIITVLEEK